MPVDAGEPFDASSEGDPNLSVASVLPEHVFDRTHLDAPETRGGPPGCQVDRFVHIFCLDQEDPAELFLRLGIRAIEHRPCASSDLHDCSSPGALQGMGSH